MSARGQECVNRHICLTPVFPCCDCCPDCFPGLSTLLYSTLLIVELSKLAELNDSAGGYDWAWQKEAKARKEKLEAAGAAGAIAEDGDAKAALKLSMDNILMVGGNSWEAIQACLLQRVGAGICFDAWRLLSGSVPRGESVCVSGGLGVRRSVPGDQIIF